MTGNVHRKCLLRSEEVLLMKRHIFLIPRDVLGITTTLLTIIFMASAPAFQPGLACSTSGTAPHTNWRNPITKQGYPSVQSLAGLWRVALDPNNAGGSSRWFTRDLPDTNTITLPGTTDQAHIGYPLDKDTMTYPIDFPKSAWPPSGPTSTRVNEHGHLVRPYLYIGKAWYQRIIDIPPDWNNKHIQLRLERVCWQSTVYLDDRPVGSNDSLVAEHRYDLGVLPPGPHRLTICVDNTLIHNIGILSHAYGPETQSRWNGIVGDLELIATPPQFVRSLRVFPAPDRRSVRLRTVLASPDSTTLPITARLNVNINQAGNKNPTLATATQDVTLSPGDNTVDLTIPLDNPAQTWDEFNTTLYHALITLTTSQGQHIFAQTFGFRHIERRGRHIYINNRKAFLRGTLDCCVFPKTAHPPMTLDTWLDILATIKNHGFNHVRYHSWCPPEAAFQAADLLGLYLAPETPFWLDDWITNTSSKPKCLGRDPDVLAYIEREIKKISDTYGNHPSFALFGIGNEFGNKGTDWNAVNDLLARAKKHDPRRLYSASTARKKVPVQDYWVTHTTETAGTRGVGPVHTNWDFSAAARSTDLPLIAHETGSRPVFPHYAHLFDKFTGPLKPYNLMRFCQQAQAAGLADRICQFERASALFQIIQYKSEHEAMLRTPDYAGYQLLMLNDFTGQAEAHVGILDPFWQPKGIVQPEDVRQWNSSTVPLARFNRYLWTAQETFAAQLEVAHYGSRDLSNVTSHWSLSVPDGRFQTAGHLKTATIPTGTVTTLGTIKLPLADVPTPCALTLEIQLASARNTWTVWVYPPDDQTAPSTTEQNSKPLVTKAFDSTTLAALAQGERVLLLAHGLNTPHTARTGFYSVYWTGAWAGDPFSMLGILCSPEHLALAAFPNQGHSDYQWFQLTNGATTFDLTNIFPPDYQPIVQGLTDFHHNRLLAQLFELQIGSGKLLVCGYDLTSDLPNRHAARQMRTSLLNYIQSEAFTPTQKLTPKQARTLLAPL